MGSSESPVHTHQEGVAYNGHFKSVCYHPLCCFNQFGDCEGALLRPGSVHSAERWREMGEPIVERAQQQQCSLCFWPHSSAGAGEKTPAPRRTKQPSKTWQGKGRSPRGPKPRRKARPLS